MSTDDELFTRSEVLGGFSAKRVRLLLFQIESRTAYLMMQGQRAVNLYLTEETAEQQVKVSWGTEIRAFHVDGVSKQFILSLRDSVKKDSKGSSREANELAIEVQLAGNTARKK